MIAVTFKMGTLKGLICCALIISIKMIIAESTVYASPDTALKFSQCLIERLSQTSFFTTDDRNGMIAVRDVMVQAFRSREHTLISSKILMTAFVTSLADLILNGDVSTVPNRKKGFLSALEQCSISSAGYTDAEFIAEAQRILSVFESNKPMKNEETSAFSEASMPAAKSFSSVSFSQASSAGSPILVQPSPVQNPQPPQYFYRNDRTVSEQQRNSNLPPIVSSAQVDFHSQPAIQPLSQIDIVSSFGTGMQAQPGNLPQTFNFQSTSKTGDFSSSIVSSSQYQNFPIDFAESGMPQPQKDNIDSLPGKFPNDYDIVSQSETGKSGIPQSGKDFLGLQSGGFPFAFDTGGISVADTSRSDVVSNSEFPQTGPINAYGISKTFNEGLNIPQTKESSVIVIPPNIAQQSISKSIQNQQQGVEHGIYLPPNQETTHQSEISEFSMTSSAAITQEQQKYFDVPKLKSTVFDMLKNSPKFRENFNSEISQENAINLARNLTEQTFSAYDSNIMKDALSLVTEEVMKVRVPSPETFAFAISNALVNVAQRHDSSLSVDPSQVAANFLSNLDNPGQFNSQQETIENQPKDYNTDDFSMTSPAGETQEQEQHSDVISYPKLESNIFNILTNSSKFREAFNSEISQENAINLARDLTERTFSGYGSNIVNKALSVVTEEVLKVRVPSPETFAFALSKALAYILKHNQAPLSSEQSDIAASFLSGLDNTGQSHSQQDTSQTQPQDYISNETLEQFHPQPETAEKQPQDYYTSQSAYDEFSEKLTDFDFQSPPLSPEDRKDELFSLSLAQYLAKSKAIRNFFCDANKPEDKVQLSFSIIKASLMDYGQQVATLAASVTSGALSEISKEGLCFNYAKTMSETVAEILEENGVDSANAEDVARKMELNLIQRQITPTESPRPATMPNNVPPRLPRNETYAQEPDSSFTSIREVKPPQPDEDNHPNLATPSDSKSDYEFNHPVTLLYTALGLSTGRPNIGSESWTPDENDEQTFDDYLLQHFHTLEALFSEDSDEKDKNNCEGSSTTKTIENYRSREDFKEESSDEEFSQSGNQKMKTISTPESDTISISPDQTDDDVNFNPIALENWDKLFYDQDESEITQKDIRPSNSSEDNFKTSQIELQPSFQSTTFNSGSGTAKFQRNSSVTSYDSDDTDTSVEFARELSEKVESYIAFIRSPNFDLGNLCAQINQLAPLVDIPKLDYYEAIAAIDYLLNVILALVKKGLK